MANPLAHEKFWSNKAECDEAEKNYYAKLYGKSGAGQRCDDAEDFDLFASDDEEPAPKMVVQPKGSPQREGKAAAAAKKQTNARESSDGPEGTLSAEVAKVRQLIKNSLECVDGLAAMTNTSSTELVNKLNSLEIENKNLKKVTDDLKKLVLKLEGRVAQLEKGGKPTGTAAPAAKEDDDDDVDLFGSDSEDDEEKARITAERLKAYHEKKAKKPALIAKTSVLLDIKPWDDETDMDAMLKAAKSIEKDGLVWGASKLMPVGYGINKLQLMCVVEDEKVSIDELCEQITEFEDYVQSVDIAAMSKI